MEEFDIDFGKYNNSMNFIFGINGDTEQYTEEEGEDFDVLNNPYFEYIGYDMYGEDGI